MKYIDYEQEIPYQMVKMYAPTDRISSKQKRKLAHNPKPEPPRQMTEEEKEYYKKHKTLNGFNPS